MIGCVIGDVKADIFPEVLVHYEFVGYVLVLLTVCHVAVLVADHLLVLVGRIVGQVEVGMVQLLAVVEHEMVASQVWVSFELAELPAANLGVLGLVVDQLDLGRGALLGGGTQLVLVLGRLVHVSCSR